MKGSASMGGPKDGGRTRKGFVAVPRLREPLTLKGLLRPRGEMVISVSARLRRADLSEDT